MKQGFTDLGVSDAATPQFRAVKVGKERRGIRLERVFWQVLTEMARVGSMPIGDVVASCEAGSPGPANSTSLIRVAIVRWLRLEVERLRGLTGREAIDSHIHACPSPAFALSADKRIIAYNQAFLTFLQARMSRFTSGAGTGNLRLSLDVPIVDLIQTIKVNRGRSAATGFAVGVEDQVVRARLNAVLAPYSDQDAILGYVLPG